MRSKQSHSVKRRTVFGPSRRDLLSKYHARGKAKHTLHLCYSARLQKDLVFRGDAEMLHHFWVEGDRTVASCLYEPDPIAAGIDADIQKTIFDALIRFTNGRAVLREIKSTWDDLAVTSSQTDSRASEHQQREALQLATQTRIAKNAGLEYQRITLTELAKHDLLISNWRRAIAFLSACRNVPLQSCINDLMLILHRERQMMIGDMVVRFESHREADYQAALFLAAQKGNLITDMDSMPLSRRTLLSLPSLTP